MHKSALIYAKDFITKYLNQNPSKKPLVVDVGSLNVNGSIKDILPKNVEYLGLDFEAGEGVDIIVTDPYSLPKQNESVDIVICSSVYEHSAMFWLLFLDCLRILKPDGLLYLNCPSNGMVHRFPIDAWRFYPDSGKSLIAWAKKNNYSSLLLESFIGLQLSEENLEGHWNDYVAIFLKDKTYTSLYPKRISDTKNNLRSVFAHNREVITKVLEHNQDLDQNIYFTNQIAQLTQAAENRESQIIQKH